MCGDKYEPVVSLEKHIETMQEAGEKHLREILALEIKRIDDNVVEARRQADLKFEGFPNEYARRGELLSTAATVQDLKDKELKSINAAIDLKLGKTEYEDKHQAILREVGALKETKDYLAGRASQAAVTWSIIIAIIGLLIGIAAAFRAFHF